MRDVEYLAKVLERYGEDPLPQSIESFYCTERVLKLVRLCRGLQRTVGYCSVFFLSAKSAASIIGVSDKKAAQFLKGLCRDGVIELHRSGTTGKPHQYVYIAEQFDSHWMTSELTHVALD